MIAAIIDLSTDFWSSARPAANSFFCVRVSCVPRLDPEVLNLTSGFSPCLKKASSPVFFAALSLEKYSDLETLSKTVLSNPETSSLVDVAMTYRALTRRIGTPLTLNGPVTRRTPWSRLLRRTTRLPRKRPARRMRTVPGVRDLRSLVGRIDFRTCVKKRS